MQPIERSGTAWRAGMVTELEAPDIDEVQRQMSDLPWNRWRPERDLSRAGNTVGSIWCAMMYFAAMNSADKPIRQNVRLPSRVARHVKSLVKSNKSSANRVILELIAVGLASRGQQK